jgi:protocatechuate 3,4-dioxygenase, beta subunit
MHHPITPPNYSRRTLLRQSSLAAAIALPSLSVLWPITTSHAQAARRPTPAQTEGPYYPDQMPQDTDFDLLKNGNRQYSKGQAAWLGGSVTDVQGKPISGATVEIWQCDAQGHYHHSRAGGRADADFQGFGRVRAGADGSYRFRTLRPSPYVGRTPHIHVKVWLDKHELLTTQLYVQGDAGNERDFLWRSLKDADRQALTVPFVQGADGMQAQFAVVLAI